MLTYLNGLGGKKKGGGGLLKKVLSKTPVGIAVRVAKKAAAHHAVVKKVAKTSPLAAGRIRKASVERQKRKAFAAKGEPATMPEALPEENFTSEESQDNFESNEIQDSGNVDNSDAPQQSDEELGIIYTDSDNLGKLFKGAAARNAKKQQKNATRNAKKAGKPRNVKRLTKAQGKAALRKGKGAGKQARGEGKKIKGSGGGGVFKDVASKLVDAGSSLIKKQINPSDSDDSEVPSSRGPVETSQGPQADDHGQSDGMPSQGKTFLDAIPMPVKILGGVGIAFTLYKLATKK